MASMDVRLPLQALLSHALVAYIIEFDNEFEYQMPHRTTNHGSTSDSKSVPWLVSMAMWSRFLRFIPEEGIPARQLAVLTQTDKDSLRMWLTRLGKWWGYIVFKPDHMVLPTVTGLMAQTIWRSLDSTIESRWRERFGSERIDDLRQSLFELANQFDIELPDSLPILGYGLFSSHPEKERLAPIPSDLPLSALLSKVLLAFAIEFERESEISLAITANVLRLAIDKGVTTREIQKLSGVSKEAMAMSVNYLVKKGYATLAPQPVGRSGKLLVLTDEGQRQWDLCRKRLATIEKQWRTRFGKDTLSHLRNSLGKLDDQELLSSAKLYPYGWRASLPKPKRLPDYPMILHRGGFPDGS